MLCSNLLFFKRDGIAERLHIKRERHTNLGAVVTAVLDDSLHLFVYELHTAQAGLLQTLHLSLHQQLKRHLWHKQSRTWTLQANKCYITLLSSQYLPKLTTIPSNHCIKISDPIVGQVLYKLRTLL